MKKRQFYTIALIFIFLASAIGLEFFFSHQNTNLQSYVSRIEAKLWDTEEEVQNLLNNDSFLKRQVEIKEGQSSDIKKRDLDYLNSLTTKPFNICIYDKDSLVFWSNNLAILTSEQLSSFKTNKEARELVHLSNGHYELMSREFENEGKPFFALGLIPLKNDYDLESAYLLNRFVTERYNVPESVDIERAPTEFEIKSSSGKILAWVDAQKAVKDKSQLQILLLVYLLAFVCLGVLINDLSTILVKKYQPWIGAAFLMAMVFGLRLLSIHFGFSDNFTDLQTFSHTFSTKVLNKTSSLGDLLINIILLLWMMVFFHREFQVQKFVNVSKPIRYGLTTLNYFSIILGILMITGIFKSLVLDSDITFDFDNVFNLNFYSFLAILGIILLLFALFLFSHRMMLTIMKIGLTKHQRIYALIAATIFSIPIMIVTDLMLPLPHLLLFSLIYIVLFDLFIDSSVPTLTWLVIWLVIFAAFSSILLFKYNADKDYKLRERYAIELSNFRDTLAEKGLKELEMNLLEDKEFVALFPKEQDELLSKELFQGLIETHFPDDKYLFYNYAFDVFGFFKNNDSIAMIGQEERAERIEEIFKKAKFTSSTNIKHSEEDNSNFAYFLKTELATQHAITLYFKFYRKSSNPSKLYTELLLDKQYKNLRNLKEYEYAIYKNGELIDEEGRQQYDKKLQEELPPVGESKVLKSTSQRSELLYHAPENIVVRIGKDMGGYLKPISLFSYLFSLLILTVIILAAINSFTKALPGVLPFAISRKPSLRNRIQFSVITLILFSFVMIGMITVWHFERSYDVYHNSRLNRKVDAVEINAHHEIIRMYESKSGKVDLPRLLEPISNIHRMDVNLYDLDGSLISSSENDIFKKGIVAPQMGAVAFQALSKMGKDRPVQQEKIGTLEFMSAYIPLKKQSGELLAYIGLPYYSQRRDISSNVTEFMGTLLNVYVFLLLIAGAIAIVVANSITKPISDLGDSLKRVKLGRNEPLVWDSKDELGELIAEYNRMIKKLEESTDLLAQSEREDAWREMAKQIAHEIKNPLTPMKLSIQYMMHAYQSNPANIEPLMKRVSKTLVEQIDSLSQIASEFSNFAKMPLAENSKFELNDLATSVHSLFGNESQDMDISLYLPDKQFYVYGDKNHLTRVLNNLIKNAIQAVPDGQAGKIDISIFQSDEKVVMKVSDNGSGISEDMIEKVFVPNFTTKNSGTGLGLAISKNIIDAFKGKIYFKTELDKGTDFFVELPLVDVAEVREV